MFRLLAAVPATGEPDAIDLAFQGVQLACSDYMAAMPFARLKRCLEVAVLYSSQQAGVNVSLTTISLLWNAADLFGKAAGLPARRGSSQLGVASATGLTDDASDSEVEAAIGLALSAEDGINEGSESEGAASPSSKRHQLAASLSSAQTDELLQMIFLALQVPRAWPYCCATAVRCVNSLPFSCDAGRQPGCAPRGAQQWRAYALCCGR